MEIKAKKFGFLMRLRNAFYPQRCPYCNKVIKLEDIACDECLEKFPDFVYLRTAKGGYTTISPTPFTNNFATTIKRFKFKNKPHFSYQLATPMAQAITKEYKDIPFDIISCVPLHKEKLKERGYNQSELLSKELSVLLGIPFESTLIKTRNNVPQHKLRANRREKNVKGAYKVKDKNLVDGKCILLVDDIITTGYTLGECSKVLEYSGASCIKCVTFATVVVKTT